MTITTGAVERSVVRELDDDRDDDGLDRLGEIVQEIQLEVSGSATSAMAWTDADITFDVEFIDGTGQRYSNLAEPTFTYGAVTADEVMLTANVTGYVTDERGAVIGCTVKVGAVTPGVGDSTSFTGRVDLSWQGWGCLSNEPSDPDFS